MRIFFLFLLNVFIYSGSIFPQRGSVKGFVVDSSDLKALAFAYVVLAPIPLEGFPNYTTTNSKGYFEFRRVQPGKYTLEITFLGYEKFIDTIQVNWSEVNIDTIYLKSSIIKLGEIFVIDHIPIVEQKGDTLEFNASTFKTAPNSTLEDLVMKFPGIQKEENVIKFQGEEVKRILVDGRRFFGDDPEIALKNLPAEIVDKIQLFDKKSEQAELTGFEDDQTEKAFNVLTRVDKRKGMFGKFYGGYGTTNRFNSGINYNSFNAEERISLLGIANNINQAGFTGDNISSDVQISHFQGRRRIRIRNKNQNPLLNIPINTEEGNNDIYAFGVNYSNIFENRVEINGSYFFNLLDNQNTTTTYRKYISDLSGLDRFDENISSNGRDQNHRLNIFIDYRPDTNNIFRIRPDFQITANRN